MPWQTSIAALVANMVWLMPTTGYCWRTMNKSPVTSASPLHRRQPPAGVGLTGPAERSQDRAGSGGGVPIPAQRVVGASWLMADALASARCARG